MEEDADDSCLWGSNIRASPDIPVRLRAMQWHSFPFCSSSPSVVSGKVLILDHPLLPPTLWCSPRPWKTHFMQNLWRCGEPWAQRGVIAAQQCPVPVRCGTGKSGAKLASSPLIREDLWENWMERWKRLKGDFLTLYIWKETVARWGLASSPSWQVAGP